MGEGIVGGFGEDSNKEHLVFSHVILFINPQYIAWSINSMLGSRLH